MIRSTRNVTLVLISAGLAALGFGLWEHGRSPYATTRPTGSTGYHSWYGRAFGGGGGGSSGGSSVSSGTSRGGFGSFWHSVSS